MTDKLRHGPLWTTIFAIISLIWIYPIALVFINSFKKRVYISRTCSACRPATHSSGWRITSAA